MADRQTQEHRIILEEAYRRGTGSLTPEQIAEYDEVGYIVLHGLLDEGDLARVKESMASRVDEIAEVLVDEGLIDDPLEDHPFETRLAELFRDLPESDFLRWGRGWRDRLPGYFDLMSNPKILNAIESLIGPEIFSSPIYNTRPKIPGIEVGAVPWHQDKSYWPDSDAIPVLTAWVAVADANDENACLNIWPGTHRSRVLSYHAETRTGTQYTETDEEHLYDVQIVPLPMKAGSIVIFNDRILHMSGINRSSGVRWSADLRYQPTNQDPMNDRGVGFLARSRRRPDWVATLEDWLANRSEHEDSSDG